MATLLACTKTAPDLWVEVPSHLRNSATRRPLPTRRDDGSPGPTLHLIPRRLIYPERETQRVLRGTLVPMTVQPFSPPPPFTTSGGRDDWYRTALKWTHYTLQAIRDNLPRTAGQYAHNAVTYIRWHRERKPLPTYEGETR